MVTWHVYSVIISQLSHFVFVKKNIIYGYMDRCIFTSETKEEEQAVSNQYEDRSLCSVLRYLANDLFEF